MGVFLPDYAAYKTAQEAPAQTADFQKAAVTVVAGREYTLWASVGYPSQGLGFYGTTPVTCNNATVGALPFRDSTAVQRIVKSYAQFATTNFNGVLSLHDRYIHNSGLSGTTVGSATINTPALPARAGSGVGVMAAVQIWVTIGSVATVINMSSYTDPVTGAGRVGERTTIGSTGFRDPPRWIRLPLEAGSVGVASLENLNTVVSTTSVGDYGIVLYKTLLSVPFTAVAPLNPENEGMFGQNMVMPVVPNGACLFQTLVATTTSTGAFMGYYEIAEMP